MRTLGSGWSFVREDPERVDGEEHVAVGAQLPAIILVALPCSVPWCHLERWRGNCKDWVLRRVQLGRLDRHPVPGHGRRHRRSGHQLRGQHCEELRHIYFHHTQLPR